MKMSHKFLALFLSTLVLSGCSSCPCKKNALEAPVSEAPKAVAAPVVPEVAQEAAPAIPEPVEEKIPAAVLK